MIGPSWFSCCVGKKYTGSTAQFVMPGHVKGQAIPGFLGGSDLAVPGTSSNKALAADWIKDFTSTSSEKALQAKGNIPNATNLLGASVNERAAARSWFVPTAKHWVDVENGNILRNMLAQILTGKLSDQAGSRVGQRQHRIGAQPVVTRCTTLARWLPPPRPRFNGPGGGAVSGATRSAVRSRTR